MGCHALLWDIPNSGIKITSLTSNLLQQAGSLPLASPGKPPSLALYLTLCNTLFPLLLSSLLLKTFSFFSLILIFFLSLLEIFTVLLCPASHLIKECIFSCQGISCLPVSVHILLGRPDHTTLSGLKDNHENINWVNEKINILPCHSYLFRTACDVSHAHQSSLLECYLST